MPLTVPLAPVATRAWKTSIDPYDLGVLPAEFAGLRWPTAPAITSEVTVANATQLAAALTTNGVRITVLPGTYVMRLLVRGSDQEIVFQEGAIIAPSDATALFISGARRIVIRGGSFQGGMSVQGQSSDVLLDGVSINTKRNSSPVWPDTVEFIGGLSRIAMINSTVSSRGAAGYVGNVQDFIYANNDLSSDETFVVRLQRVTRAVIVDNRFWRQVGGHHTFRAHDSSDLVYFARNQLENTGIMFNNMSPNPNVIRAWLVDNTLYHRSNSLLQVGNTVDTQWLTATGNTSYTYLCDNPAGCGEAITWRVGWGAVENNLRFPYQAPPV
jgi:hypothetical protein